MFPLLCSFIANGQTFQGVNSAKVSPVNGVPELPINGIPTPPLIFFYSVEAGQAAGMPFLVTQGYKGWDSVDLDFTRNGPHASYERSGRYIVERLETIYA